MRTSSSSPRPFEEMISLEILIIKARLLEYLSGYPPFEKKIAPCDLLSYVGPWELDTIFRLEGLSIYASVLGPSLDVLSEINRSQYVE